MKYVLFSVYKIVCDITNFGVLLEYLPQILLLVSLVHKF